jgi:DDE superfamily endonuclease
MTPYFNDPENEVERNFNQFHKDTRRLVESAYGSLKEKFPSLNYLRLAPEKAAKVIMACATLHNISKMEEFHLPNENALLRENYGIRTGEVDPDPIDRLERILNQFRQN